MADDAHVPGELQMTEKDHYSEADLLETYYMQPGESMSVMMHLADCVDCAGRYERIERKVRGLAACDHDEKPETFWVRQRMSILRRVGSRAPEAGHWPRTLRVAAAAVLFLILGGIVTSKRLQLVQPVAPAPVVVQTATAVSNEPALTRPAEDTTDPWQSDELKEFGSMVEWESWVDNGDKSL
jgi:hypothetical protein